MPNEITFLNDIINPQVMGNMISAKIEALNKITRYIKVDTTLQGVPGDTKTVPMWDYSGDAVEVAEGEEVETSKLTATTTTFTIKKAMKSFGITQESINSGLGDPVGQAGLQIAQAISGKIDNDGIDAAYTSTNLVTAETPINYKAIVTAVCQFEDEEDGTEKVMFIHPKQEAALLQDPDFLSADKFTPGVALNGSIGKIAGCWIKKSKKVKTKTTGSGEAKKTTYLNPIIKLEPDSPETEYTEDELPALTLFLKKDTQVDHEWLPRKQTHYLTGSKYYGMALTNAAKVIILEVSAGA